MRMSEEKMAESQLLLFGDLSATPFEDQLRALLHVETNPLLQDFFSRVSFALRRFLGTLPAHQQDLFPRFTTLIDLVAKVGETKGTTALRFFLLSVYEVAQFIVYFSNGSRQYPQSPKTCIISPCTGGFAAAAIACSATITELVPVAVEAALAAFRTALCSLTVGASLADTPSETTGSSWSVVVSPKTGNTKVEDLIEQYFSEGRDSGQTNNNNSYPIWVSATVPPGVTTLSGRPSVLADFIAANKSTLKYRFLDNIGSPYHAAHLFEAADVDDIVNLGAVASRTVRIPVLSSSTGNAFNVIDFESLLREIVHETLCVPIQWDAILSSYTSMLHETGLNIRRCHILPFASTMSTLVSNALTADLGAEVRIGDLSPSVDTIPDQPTGKFEHSNIAIIGYSGRFPNSDSTQAFWDLLHKGLDVHREIPADRFDWKTHYDATGKTKNTSRVKYGCFIDEPGVFDARFFNMSPREAENTDPAQRLAITTAYEAMEMAGMVRNRTPSTQQDRIGVFFGTTSDDWREVNSGQNVDTYFIPGGNRAFVPGRISYFFGFSGPSLSIDTACSSSFAAIQAACGYLWRGECDTTIAGGTNILTNPDNFAGLDRGHFLSTTGNCNAFDDGANGYCRADAVGTVILKRLEDAIADGDPVLGVIRGTNTNHCGQTDSITRPHEGDQASVFRRITRYAGMDPLDVSYVEMHGTGTQAGDATEMSSVLSVFVPKNRSRIQGVPKDQQRPLYIGSAKGNIGHAESASGVTSLIKALMMMKNNEIPPHAGVKTKINTKYPKDLQERGVNIAFKPTPWRREDMPSGKRAVFLNNFSAAGGNTAILLEDAPLKTPKAITQGVEVPSVYTVTVTAKSAKSLHGNITTLIKYLEQNPSTSLPSLSYTTTARRTHHNFRVAVSGGDIPAIISSLKTLAAQDATSFKAIPRPVKTRKLVFAFSGQGTFYLELGKPLYAANSAFRSRIQALNKLAKSMGFPPFLGLIDGSHTGGTDVLRTEQVHLALTCVQIALADLLRSWGITPTGGVVGHSLGEYAALYTAGVLSAGDAIYLVGTRASILEKRCVRGTHAMLAIKASRPAVEQLLQTGEGKACELACANQPLGQVIAGPKSSIAAVTRKAGESGIETIPLDTIPYAFHSAQVDPIIGEFEAAAGKGVLYHPPTVPVISPLLKRVIEAGESGVLNANYLVNACRGMVDFTSALTAAHASKTVTNSEAAIWLEIGAHPACGGMVKGTLGPEELTLATLRKGMNPYKTLAVSLEALYLAGVGPVDWNEFHRGHSEPNKEVISELPRYAWDLKNYWIDYRYDFCLTKGSAPATVAVAAPEVKMVETPKPKYRYLSPAVQRVLEENHGRKLSSMLIESDIFDEKLLPMLKGHVVNGTALCPSSLYGDIALTIGTSLLQGANLSVETTGLEVGNVRIDKPLVAMPNTQSHCFRVSATADWASGLIEMDIYSVDANGKRSTPHAKLDVTVVANQKWSEEWKRSNHLITSRVESLQAGVLTGQVHKMHRGMAYKLFGALVEYSPEYRGMADVILDSERLEAVSTVKFQTNKDITGFHTDARWIDSLGQVAGFIMNANDGVDSKNQVFINHGWERMRFAEPLVDGKEYKAYNRMQLVEEGKTKYAGDTYVLDGKKVVAVYEGVVFVGVPRAVLDRALPGGTRSAPVATATQQPKQASSAPQKVVVEAPKPAIKVAKPKAKPSAPKKPSVDILSRVVAVIAEEVGVSASDIKPETEFGDLGIDSLLSLNILARIRDEVGLELPSSLFMDHPSFKDLQGLLGNTDSDDSSESSTPVSDDDSEDESASDITTATESVSGDEVEESTSGGERVQEVCKLLKQIIADETSVALSELTPSASLADMGIDSLLGLTITGTLSEKLDTEVPGGMLMEHDTIQELEDALIQLLGLTRSSANKIGKKPAQDLASKTTERFNDSLISSPPHATSILLSGSPTSPTAKSVFFLFPDGSGSAASYAALAPTIGADVIVYGLNCPWRKTASEMTRVGVTMEPMVAKYLIEIRRVLNTLQASRSAKGLNVTKPLALSLGGWSAGGILALEGVRQFTASGVSVDKLVLFDSPNPIGLENPPARMYDFFDSLGIFGAEGKSGKTPEWLRDHFDAFIRVLDAYEPLPLSGGVAVPKTVILYARDGIYKSLGAGAPRMETRGDDPREMIWLLNDRTDFAADGWASLVGRRNLEIKVLDGVNHFTMMDKGPRMAELGRLTGEFLL